MPLFDRTLIVAVLCEAIVENVSLEKLQKMAARILIF